MIYSGWGSLFVGVIRVSWEAKLKISELLALVHSFDFIKCKCVYQLRSVQLLSLIYFSLFCPLVLLPFLCLLLSFIRGIASECTAAKQKTSARMTSLSSPRATRCGSALSGTRGANPHFRQQLPALSVLGAAGCERSSKRGSELLLLSHEAFIAPPPSLGNRKGPCSSRGGKKGERCWLLESENRLSTGHRAGPVRKRPFPLWWFENLSSSRDGVSFSVLRSSTGKSSDRIWRCLWAVWARTSFWPLWHTYLTAFWENFYTGLLCGRSSCKGAFLSTWLLKKTPSQQRYRHSLILYSQSPEEAFFRQVMR